MRKNDLAEKISNISRKAFLKKSRKYSRPLMGISTIGKTKKLPGIELPY
jgi:hypothetical protein